MKKFTVENTIVPLLKRLDRDLEGVNFGREGARVKAMVDDVTVFVSTNEDIKKTRDTTRSFCEWTGTRISQT